LQSIDNAPGVIEAIMPVFARPVFTVDEVQREIIGQEERRGRKIFDFHTHL